MVDGSDAVSVTDCNVLYVPPAGDADTVGGVVSDVGGEPALTFISPILAQLFAALPFTVIMTYLALTSAKS